MFENTFVNRVLHKTLGAMLLIACLLWSVARAYSDSGPAHPAAPESGPGSLAELPSHWQGRMLRPLALSEVEQRFARRFPGSLARLAVAPADGEHEQVLVLRTVDRPTRMLHPAADCYQGLGFRVTHEQLELDAQQRLWRCFEAARAGHRQRVCERIVDAQAQGFTDASAWYWAAVSGRSQGPWQAITIARPL